MRPGEPYCMEGCRPLEGYGERRCLFFANSLGSLPGELGAYGVLAHYRRPVLDQALTRTRTLERLWTRASRPETLAVVGTRLPLCSKFQRPASLPPGHNACQAERHFLLSHGPSMLGTTPPETRRCARRSDASVPARQQSCPGHVWALRRLP